MPESIIDKWVSKIITDNGTIIGLINQGNIIGYVIYFYEKQDEQNSLNLYHIQVHPDYQNKGNGKKLIGYILCQLEPTLDNILVICNQVDCGFFEKSGFSFQGEIDEGLLLTCGFKSEVQH